MNFDYFAKLAAEQACPKEDAVEAHDLASGFVDGCTTWFAVNALRAAECEARLKDERDKNRKKQLEQKKREHERAKNDARRCYMERAGQRPLELPQELRLDPWPPELLHRSWLAFEVEFELLTPWYSKDDRLFHVLDNPVRKDRVFGVPYMSAASWKGMLRWGCRMQAGLREHLQQGRRFADWRDPDWILHLFGNEKGEEKNFHQGALVFYPTWFDKIGFEVINPQDRSRRAGTQPIYYEVVPGRRPKPDNPSEYEEGGNGALHLLYAPWPGMEPAGEPKEVMRHLLDAIETLLTAYGISAKRTVGWGTAEIKKWRAWKKDTPDGQSIEADSREDLLKQLLPNSRGAS
jgi:CRISPR-associated protein Cmr2